MLCERQMLRNTIEDITQERDEAIRELEKLRSRDLKQVMRDRKDPPLESHGT